MLKYFIMILLLLVFACDKEISSSIYNDPFEPNDTFADAFKLEITEEVEGLFHTYTDKDIYFFEVEKDKEYHIILNVPTGSDINIQLFDDSENKIAESVHGKSINEYIQYEALSNGKLYVKCYPASMIKPHKKYTVQILCGDIPKPDTPVNVTASDDKKNKIAVSWNEVNKIDFYSIERSISISGTWAQLATTTNCNYTDVAVIAKTSYHYRVRAYSKKYSEYSNIVDGKRLGDTEEEKSKIAFRSTRDGNAEIYIMSADGSSQTRLTNNNAADCVPSISADGSKITFRSTRDGNTEIYIMSADGSSQTRLTNNNAADSAPSISADGSKIAFTAYRDGNAEIYIMNADGSSQTRLTNNPANDFDPSISADGLKIAFRSERDGNAEIYIMSVDGSSKTRLTNNNVGDYAPSISADGSKIAFTSTRAGNAEIYIMSADGSSQTRLTNDPANDLDPSISADGSKIAFTAYRDGNAEIYIMRADGSSQARLTNNMNDYEPSITK